MKDSGSKKYAMPGEFRKALQGKLIFGLHLKGETGVCHVGKGRIASSGQRNPYVKSGVQGSGKGLDWSQA